MGQRTTEIIDAEITDLAAQRREINTKLTALRRERRAAAAVEEAAHLQALGARFMDAAGDPEQLQRLAAEVTAGDAGSGAGDGDLAETAGDTL